MLYPLSYGRLVGKVEVTAYSGGGTGVRSTSKGPTCKRRANFEGPTRLAGAFATLASVKPRDPL